MYASLSRIVMPTVQLCVYSSAAKFKYLFQPKKKSHA